MHVRLSRKRTPWFNVQFQFREYLLVAMEKLSSSAAVYMATILIQMETRATYMRTEDVKVTRLSQGK